MESIPSDWVNTMLLAGAVQGVFLAAVLVGRRQNTAANRYLAAAMLAFSIDLFAAVFHDGGLIDRFPQLIGIDFPLAFLYGPLFYLYVRSLTRGTGRVAPHFIPFALVVLLTLPFYLGIGGDRLEMIRSGDFGAWTPLLATINHVKLPHGLAYVLLTIGLLRGHRKRIRDAFSSVEHVNLAWLRDVTVALAAMWSVAAVAYAFQLTGGTPVLGPDPIGAYDDYVLLAVTAFIYGIGYFGLRQPEIEFIRGYDRSGMDEGTATPSANGGPRYARSGMDEEAASPTASGGRRYVRSGMDEGTASPQANGGPRYARSGMDEWTAADHLERLLDLMDRERPYLRGDLTLLDLASALSVSPHHLTEVLNTRLGRNFYDFVNGYRVQEAKALLSDPENDHLTVLAIGMDAGFNSKSSFNAVFKKYTSMTPSQYRAQVAAPA